jgi:hypothetical protein
MLHFTYVQRVYNNINWRTSSVDDWIKKTYDAMILKSQPKHIEKNPSYEADVYSAGQGIARRFIIMFTSFHH